MRQCLAIFLLVFMPLQLSWAAVAGYCHHETGAAGAAGKHFGHHDHQHQATDGKTATPDPAKIGGDDPDCAACHAGCASPAPGLLLIPTVDTSSSRQPDDVTRIPAPPPGRLDRPQWCALA